jgi:hypothetical protein
MKKLPPLPDRTEEMYHIRDADNLVRVVIRNRYAHMGHRNLLNIRVEVRHDTGPDTVEWKTVKGSIQGLMDEREATRRAAAIYHGDWKDMVGPEYEGTLTRATEIIE